MGLWQRRISNFLLTYMIVCNLAIWGSCSFLEMEYKKGNVSLYIINEIVLGETNWRFVTTFLFPLVLYFRFHSAKLILISITHVHSAENPWPSVLLLWFLVLFFLISIFFCASHGNRAILAGIHRDVWPQSYTLSLNELSCESQNNALWDSLHLPYWIDTIRCFVCVLRIARLLSFITSNTFLNIYVGSNWVTNV